jgi:diamine N-acetyltransferase
MTDAYSIKLRPLEREDLRFVHQLDNNASVMRYWFEEPYEAFVELSDLYDKHIHDQSERRFVIECNGEKAGLVELVEINHVHRRAEFQIIISPDYQEKVWRHAPRSWRWTTVLPFSICINCISSSTAKMKKPIHIYRKLGFMVEGADS